MEQVAIENASTVKLCCPACFFTLDSDSVFSAEGAQLHPTCAFRWAELNPLARLQRQLESKRLHMASLWTNAPAGDGEYWARRVGCDTPAVVSVRQMNGSYTIQCGLRAARPLSAYVNYQFLRKAA